VTVIAAVIKEGRAIGLISFRTIQLTRLALRRHAIALDVAQMSAGRAKLPRFELGDPPLPILEPENVLLLLPLTWPAVWTARVTRLM
jgi:hypothetical protein